MWPKRKLKKPLAFPKHDYAERALARAEEQVNQMTGTKFLEQYSPVDGLGVRILQNSVGQNVTLPLPPPQYAPNVRYDCGICQQRHQGYAIGLINPVEQILIHVGRECLRSILEDDSSPSSAHPQWFFGTTVAPCAICGCHITHLDGTFAEALVFNVKGRYIPGATGITSSFDDAFTTWLAYHPNCLKMEYFTEPPGPEELLEQLALLREVKFK
jgi:hypothetical protein